MDCKSKAILTGSSDRVKEKLRPARQSKSAQSLQSGQSKGLKGRSLMKERCHDISY
ncbi:MAG: hypothetical protein FWH17_01195 [Oscillospiraceae bacterium]|nr:hypothetical protein [Oscillospiraceae bacterium]